MSYERKRRIKINSKGYTQKNWQQRFVIYKDGKYCRGRSEFSFRFVNLEMSFRRVSGDANMQVAK